MNRICQRRFTVRKLTGVTVVTLTGERDLDLKNYDETLFGFSEFLHPILPMNIILDCRAIRVLSVPAIGRLRSINRQIVDDKQSRFIVCELKPQLSSQLEFLKREITVTDILIDALKKLQGAEIISSMPSLPSLA